MLSSVWCEAGAEVHWTVKPLMDSGSNRLSLKMGNFLFHEKQSRISSQIITWSLDQLVGSPNISIIKFYQTDIKITKKSIFILKGLI